MSWHCDLTTLGWLVTWCARLPENAVVRFMAGMAETDLTQMFESASASGSEIITLPNEDSVHPNAIGRMDIYADSGTSADLLETGQVRPLVPGLSVRDLRLLNKQAMDHRRRARMYGQVACLYRQQITGDKCPQCTDPVTKARLTHKCTLCGGSGRTEGWLGPYAVYVLFTQMHTESTGKAGAGVLGEAVQATVRLDAFPRAKQNDRLFLPSAGMIYIIGSPIQTVAGISGVPAVIECPARMPDPDTSEAVVPSEWLS